MNRPVIPEECPHEMLPNNRTTNDIFELDELLYRRVPAQSAYFDFGRNQIAMDSVQLPDMSVDRSTFGRPEWFLIEFRDAGVASIEVGNLPPPIQHAGVTWYTSFAKHRPQKRNYAHSQVEAYEASRPIEDSKDGIHLEGRVNKIHPDVHLRWRYMLFKKLRLVVAPLTPLSSG